MENQIIEIPVKVIFIGEFESWEQWLKNVNTCSQKYGVTSQLLHQDSNGFRTSGYDLRNSNGNTVYPVKTYLLVQNPEVRKPTPFKAILNK